MDQANQSQITKQPNEQIVIPNESDFQTNQSQLHQYESLANDQGTIDELKQTILQASKDDIWMNKKDPKFNTIAKHWRKPGTCSQLFSCFS